ncbi:MAG TPA: hypothetical protein VMD99_07700 [Terriglobales bacterium]|nr:hypothetical protein [Terriglobales bacterium]
MPSPSINIEDGSIDGTLAKGQPFYWYNPTSADVTVANCGTWCGASSYTVPAGQYVEATILANPNSNAYAFTESPNEWDAPGMPHISAPGFEVTRPKEAA